MTTSNQIYRCEICGNSVEVVNNGAGTLVCCNAEMKLMQEQKGNEGLEKHVPIIEKIDGGIKIRVGSVLHPMQDTHYIQWIEVISGKRVFKKNLRPGDTPEAEFPVPIDNLTVRAYCNLHGLWKN